MNGSQTPRRTLEAVRQEPQRDPRNHRGDAEAGEHPRRTDVRRREERHGKEQQQGHHGEHQHEQTRVVGLGVPDFVRDDATQGQIDGMLIAGVEEPNTYSPVDPKFSMSASMTRIRLTK